MKLQLVKSKDIDIFWHWVLFFVEVIFLVVGLVHAGQLCLHILHLLDALWFIFKLNKSF